jgi:hypothetical protein
MIRSGLKFSVALTAYPLPSKTGLAELQWSPGVREYLDMFRQSYMGEYRLEYCEYDVASNSVLYEVVFDDAAEHTAFVLRYQ